jgi:hypothetical protein
LFDVAATSRRSTIDDTERRRLNFRNSLLFQVTVATASGVSSGAVLAWLTFSSHMSARGSYWGLAPSVLSFLVFGALAALRLPKVDTTVSRLAGAVFAGLVAVLVVGSMLIQMVGCRFDACINL